MVTLEINTISEIYKHLAEDHYSDYNIVITKREYYMKLSNGVKPISYFKAHASEVINDVVENQNTMIITQNGEAKVVLQDVRSYEQMQESLAMLKILALSTKSINEENYKSADDAFSDMDKKIGEKELS